MVEHNMRRVPRAQDPSGGEEGAHFAIVVVVQAHAPKGCPFLKLF